MRYKIDIEVYRNDTGETMFLYLSFMPGQKHNWLFDYKIRDSCLYPTKRVARIYCKRFIEFYNQQKGPLYIITEIRFTRF